MKNDSSEGEKVYKNEKKRLPHKNKSTMEEYQEINGIANYI